MSLSALAALVRAHEAHGAEQRHVVVRGGLGGYLQHFEVHEGLDVYHVGAFLHSAADLLFEHSLRLFVRDLAVWLEQAGKRADGEADLRAPVYCVLRNAYGGRDDLLDGVGAAARHLRAVRGEGVGEDYIRARLHVLFLEFAHDLRILDVVAPDRDLVRSLLPKAGAYRSVHNHDFLHCSVPPFIPFFISI